MLEDKSILMILKLLWEGKDEKQSYTILSSGIAFVILFGKMAAENVCIFVVSQKEPTIF